MNALKAEFLGTALLQFLSALSGTSWGYGFSYAALGALQVTLPCYDSFLRNRVLPDGGLARACCPRLQRHRHLMIYRHGSDALGDRGHACLVSAASCTVRVIVDPGLQRILGCFQNQARCDGGCKPCRRSRLLELQCRWCHWRTESRPALCTQCTRRNTSPAVI